MRIFKDRKLFGLFNLLDILIIVVILSGLIPFLHYYIKFNQKGAAERLLMDNYISAKQREATGFRTLRTGTIEVVASLKNLTDEDVKKIKVGDKELLPDGTVAAEICGWVSLNRIISWIPS
jgi:hypothetical protein